MGPDWFYNLTNKVCYHIQAYFGLAEGPTWVKWKTRGTLSLKTYRICGSQRVNESDFLKKSRNLGIQEFLLRRSSHALRISVKMWVVKDGVLSWRKMELGSSSLRPARREKNGIVGQPGNGCLLRGKALEAPKPSWVRFSQPLSRVTPRGESRKGRSSSAARWRV